MQMSGLLSGTKMMLVCMYMFWVNVIVGSVFISFIHTYISDWICKNLPIEFPIDLDFLPHTNCVFWSSLKLYGHSVILK